mmetsp:Transcript_19767/g.41383  ORF Transcript_19767/g.41383 Transcript_19767/m.41383 type:complete len:164 (+) Transcript_19767:27-518(+)
MRNHIILFHVTKLTDNIHSAKMLLPRRILTIPNQSHGKLPKSVTRKSSISNTHTHAQRKLFLSNLPKLRTDPELDLRRAELERAFRKYGGPSGAVLVSVQKHSSIAFVEVASEQLADLALVQMAGKYRITKARRTKHEALMEERAKKEKEGGGGGGKESVDWD